MVDARKTGRADRPEERPEDAGAPGSGARAPRPYYSLSEEETAALGRTLARRLSGGELVLLTGDLGLGKTVFARGLAAGLGVAEEDVRSPSYTLIQEYTGGRCPVFHVDLYRLDDEEDLQSIGVEEILAGGGVVIVEWGERLPGHLRRDAVEVVFHDIGEGSRRIELRAPRDPEHDGPLRGDA